MEDNQYVRVWMTTFLELDRIGPADHSAKNLFMDDVIKVFFLFVLEHSIHYFGSVVRRLRAPQI